MIELDDKSYIVGVWFADNPINLNNWLCCIIRHPENPKNYKGWYRFRYVKDDKIFDSEDEKRWTTFSIRDRNEDEIIIMMDEMQTMLKSGYPILDTIVVKGSLKKLIDLSKNKDWMFLKEEKIN